MNERTEHNRKQRTEYRRKNPRTYLLTSCRSSAKTRGIRFELTLDDIIIPEYCPFLGCKLTNTLESGKVWSNASIDRINPNLGYVTGNVQVISFLANRMKQDASPEQLITFATNILKFYKKD